MKRVGVSQDLIHNCCFIAFSTHDSLVTSCRIITLERDMKDLCICLQHTLIINATSV